jgi:hypothetical protein
MRKGFITTGVMILRVVRTKLDIYVLITVLEDATIHDILMVYNKLAHPRINLTSTVIVQHSLTLNRIVEFVSKHFCEQ